VNFLNPDIKKDPFSLKEDIFLLEKRLEIGNKWAEIIKSMTGRTENNIKNRFNMLLKNMKDEALRKLEYQNIKEASKRGVKPEDLDENALIEELIRRKKLQL
jgi:transcription factor MYB, plant